MMHRRILLSLICFLPLVVWGQDSARQPLFLVLEGGGGLGVYRDAGASPLRHRGPQLGGSLGVEAKGNIWQWAAGMRLQGGGYGYKLDVTQLFAYGGQLSAYGELLRRVGGTSPLSFWAGVGVDELFDLRYNSQLSNASVGMSNFVRLRLTARGEGHRHGWMAWAQAWVDPVALMLRPGFPYVNNYDRDIANPVACALDQYGWYVAGLTGVASQVGIRRHLKRGNALGLAYSWQYVTSRTAEDTAPWRFQQASHGLTFQLLFCL